MNYKMMYLLSISRNDFIYESVGVFSLQELAEKYIDDNYKIWNSNMSSISADDLSLIECYRIERIAFIE